MSNRDPYSDSSEIGPRFPAHQRRKLHAWFCDCLIYIFRRERVCQKSSPNLPRLRLSVRGGAFRGDKECCDAGDRMSSQFLLAASPFEAIAAAISSTPCNRTCLMR